MCCRKSSYELRLLPNLLSSLVVVCLLEVVAYYSGCSSSHSSDFSDYSGYLTNLGLDSESCSSTCSGRYYLHTAPDVVGFADSHTVLAAHRSINAFIGIWQSVTRRDPRKFFLECLDQVSYLSFYIFQSSTSVDLEGF